MIQDSTTEAMNTSTKQALESRALAPRFYTTNCKEIGEYDIEPVRDEWDAMMAAFELDKNREHFKQNYDRRTWFIFHSAFFRPNTGLYSID